MPPKLFGDYMVMLKYLTNENKIRIHRYDEGGGNTVGRYRSHNSV